MRTDKKIKTYEVQYKTELAATLAENSRYIDAASEGCWSISDMYAEALSMPLLTQEQLCASQNEQDLLIWCLQTIMESPTAAALLDNGRAQDWSLYIGETSSDRHALYVEDMEIALDNAGLDILSIARSPYFRNNFLINFIAALRDIWHETNIGDMVFEYAPQDILMLERIKEADVMTTAIHICWELRGAGYTDIWRYILGSSFGDMAMAYSRNLEKEALGAFNGTALADTFHVWFDDLTRVNPCDHDALEMIDAALVEMKKLTSSKNLNGGFIAELTRLPGGLSYLGKVSSGILSDPHFSGCHTEFNQTHLFHVIYDMKVHHVCGVPFADAELASKIFPDS